jgi:hypothetical protein
MGDARYSFERWSEPINLLVVDIPLEVIRMSDHFMRIGQMSDFPIGSLKRVRVGKNDVVVANVDGILYVIAASCT